MCCGAKTALLSSLVQRTESQKSTRTGALHVHENVKARSAPGPPRPTPAERAHHAHHAHDSPSLGRTPRARRAPTRAHQHARSTSAMPWPPPMHAAPTAV